MRTSARTHKTNEQTTSTDSSLRDALVKSTFSDADEQQTEQADGQLPFLRTAPKRGKIARIAEHTDQELEAAIEEAREAYGFHFWKMLHGIDAFLERRHRKGESRLAALELKVARIEGVLKSAARELGDTC